MKSYVFQVVVDEDVQEDGEKAFHGYCPALPGCHTWGYTADEALAKVQEAVSLYVEDLIALNEPVSPSIAECGADRLTWSVTVSARRDWDGRSRTRRTADSSQLRSE